MKINKQTWIALAAMVAAIAVFWIVRSGSSTNDVDSFELTAITELERIEIMPAMASDGPELIVLERRGPRDWWVSRPVEARMERNVADEFESTFTRTIGSDDRVVDSDRLESYDLDDENSVRLALFSAGNERPIREVVVGREVEIPQTGVRRTFIKEVGADVIYRAQAGFGDLVRLPVNSLRDRTILVVGNEGLEGLRFLHADGHQVELIHADGDWQLADGPASVRGVDTQASSRLAMTLGRLDASDFVDGSGEDVGLDAPQVVVEVKTGERTVELEVSVQSEQGERRYFVRRKGERFIYEVDSATGQQLTSRLDDVRDRRIIKSGSAAIEEIVLGGDEQVHLKFDDQRWEMLQPQNGQLEQSQAISLAEFAGALRVQRFTDKVSADEAGLNSEDRRTVMINIAGTETILHIGDHLPETRGAHYGRYSEIDELFVLSRSTVERLTAGPERFASQ